MKEKYDGLIDMEFSARGKNSYAKKTWRKGNSWLSFRIPTAGDIPYYFFITTGGGYVAGEHYKNQVKVNDNAHAILTTQAPTYIYVCPNGEITHQLNDFTLGENAVLEFYQDETIPYKDSNFQQKTTINMDKGAKLILTDGLSNGWSPDQTPFQYGSVGMQTTINYDGRLVYNDYMLVDPREDPMQEIGYFEGKANFNSVVIIDEDVNHETVEQLRDHLDGFETDVHYGISMLEEDGLVLRLLSNSAFENHEVMWEFVRYYREEILHYPEFNLRKNNHLEREHVEKA